MLSELDSFENFIVREQLWSDRLETKFIEFWASVFDDWFHMIYHFHEFGCFGCDHIDKLALRSAIPKVFRLQHDLQERVQYSMETRKTLIDPYVCIVLDQRIPIVKEFQHFEEAWLTNLLKLVIWYDMKVLRADLPKKIEFYYCHLAIALELLLQQSLKIMWEEFNDSDQ